MYCSYVLLYCSYDTVVLFRGTVHNICDAFIYVSRILPVLLLFMNSVVQLMNSTVQQGVPFRDGDFMSNMLDKP